MSDFFFHRRSSVDLSKLNFPSFGLSLFALATVGGRDTKHLLTKKSRCYDINVIRQVAGYVDAPATLLYGSRTPLTCTASLGRNLVPVRDSKSKGSLADQKKLVRQAVHAGRRRRELSGEGGAGDRSCRGMRLDAVVLPVPSRSCRPPRLTRDNPGGVVITNSNIGFAGVLGSNMA